jgi:ABC-type transporter Mla subunit MlaD
MDMERNGAWALSLRDGGRATISDAEKIVVMEGMIASLTVEVGALRTRNTGLLDANNREVERRRTAERERDDARRQRDDIGEALIELHGFVGNLKARADRAERIVHGVIAENATQPDPRHVFALAAEGLGQ